MSTEYKLSKKQLEFYKTQGYLVCNDIFSSQEINNIVKWSLEIENFPETKGKWMKYYDQSLKEQSKNTLTRVENFFDYHKEFKSFFSTKKILNIISMLLESEPVLFKDKLNLKLPGAKGFKPHQDATIWKDMYGIKSFITAAISIDFSDLENGCLEVAGDKHKQGLISPSWKEIPENIEKKLNWQPLQTSPGDVIFMNDYTPHRSADNLSDKSRRIVFLTYIDIDTIFCRAIYYTSYYVFYIFVHKKFKRISF